ncbi:MAG: hypothetical protein ACEPOV_13365 [Hyphomicrobiales bacterium]
MISLNNKDTFYSKILLFGEYSVILNSMGLSIPYAHFKGELSFINDYKYTDLDFAQESNRQLTLFYDYLQILKTNNKLLVDINLEEFKADIDTGIYFESSIPQGYGIGSSGALVAAIYNKYTGHKIDHKRNPSQNQTNILKSHFAQMESFFHGTSSGLDPLNSYLQYPILTLEDNRIETIGIPRNKHLKDAAIFLLNTRRTSKTSPLVNIFMDKCKDLQFKEQVEQEMIKYNNACIHHLLNGKTEDFFSNLHLLSTFEFNNLKEMIPSDFYKIWESGLETNEFILKLCGSGGGGFLLGFTKDYRSTKETMNKHQYETILVYKND